MRGQLFINDKDAWATWNVKLDDGFESLRLPSSPKEYASNDARSQPGKQVVVKDTQPQAKDVQLVFSFSCNSADEYNLKFDLFVEELTGVISLKVPAHKKIYKLRVTDYLDLSEGIGLMEGRLSVRFSEDNPKNRIQL